MTTPTEDPSVVITDAVVGEYVKYRSEDGREWVIYGKCIQCGDCEVGAVYPDDRLVWVESIPVGQPGACYRKDGAGLVDRLDNPVTPDGPGRAWPNCSLRGEWL